MLTSNIVSILASLVTIIGVIGSALYFITGIKTEVMKLIDQRDAQIATRIDTSVLITSETVMAIRQKMTDMEMWNRDNFIRRESFFEIIRRMDASQSSSLEDLKAQMNRLMDKVDELKR